MVHPSVVVRVGGVGRAHLSEAYDRVQDFVLERQVEGRWELQLFGPKRR